MKVVVLSRSGMFCEGGTATYLSNIMPSLVEKGHEITVYNSGINLERQHLFPTIEHITVKTNHILLNDYLESGSRYVEHALEHDDADIFHIHYPPAAYYIDKIKAAGKKVIVTYHGSRLIKPSTTNKYRTDLYYKYIETLSKADAVVTHSPITFSKFKEREINNVHRINLATKIYKKKSLQEIEVLGLKPGKYIFYIGKLRHEKGADLLINAFKHLKTDLDLVLAGSFNYEPEYAKRCIEQASSDKRIKFVREVLNRKKEELFSNAYLVVNPLRIKGLPLTALEAMGYGKCVLNSDQSLHHKALKKHTHHFRNEDPDSLATELKFLLNHPNYVKNRGKDARTFVKRHHSWVKVINLYDHLYRTV